uniref:Uncharacterized protein n=1 Tax=Trichogramma kaykai TaxID=54128 RepID=A0ABD2WIR2_9HYME
MDPSTSDAQNSKTTVSSITSMINQNIKTESSTTIDDASKLKEKPAQKKNVHENLTMKKIPNQKNLVIKR